MERAGEFALGDGERAECHAEVLGDLLGAYRSPGPDQSADASQGDDGARGPRAGRPCRITPRRAASASICQADCACARPQRRRHQEAGGVLAGGSLIAEEPALPAHPLDIDRAL